MRLHVVVNILLGAGYVELNPGGRRCDPAIKLLQKLRDGQSAIVDKLAKIINQQTKFESLLSECVKRLHECNRTENTGLAINSIEDEVRRHFAMPDGMVR